MDWTRGVAAGAVLLAACTVSGAAQVTDTTRVIPLDPVVVTVTHLEVLRSRLPNSVSVVSREQIRESGAASVLQVVNEQVPGVFVTQRGVLGYGVAQGAAGRITMRGIGASPNTQVLVMTDGRPQMMGLMGHPIADSHVSSNVERVEVVRGPASVLYGTSAMGGVVNIITRRNWLPGALAEGGVTYGSHDTRRFEGAVEYGFGTETGVSIAANSYRTDGHRPWSSFEIDNASVRGSTALRPGLTFVADAALSDLHTFDPGPMANPRVDNWVDILRTTSGVSLENRGGTLEGATRVFVNTGRHRIHDGFFSRDYTVGVQLHQGMRLGGGRTVTVGGDAKRFGGEAENERTGVNWGSHTADEVGAFAVLHAPLVRRVVATGGMRVNHHSAYGVELAPQVGLALNVVDGTTVRAHSARGFRSPTIRELYLFPAPTPDLEPERAWTSEVSLLQQFGTRATLELALYRTEGSNLIRTTGAPPNLRLENTGEFLHRGGEVAIQTAPLRGLEFDASWGYLDVGALTQSHPKHQFSAGARYAFDRFTTRVGVQHVAGLYAGDFARNRLPDYTVVSARVAARLPGRLTAFVSGENLLDEEYQVMAGYPMPGRGLSLGLQARSR